VQGQQGRYFRWAFRWNVGWANPGSPVPLPHERDARAYISYCTFTVTIAMLRPYWLVAYSV
jgi:hypothetical protein